MSIFQLIALVFAFLMMYLVTLHHRKQFISRIEVSMWISLWFLFIVISLFPNLLLGIVGILHFDRVFDLLIVIALMIITTLVVVTYFNQKKLRSELEIFVSKDAIQSAVGKKQVVSKSKKK